MTFQVLRIYESITTRHLSDYVLLTNLQPFTLRSLSSIWLRISILILTKSSLMSKMHLFLVIQ